MNKSNVWGRPKPKGSMPEPSQYRRIASTEKDPVAMTVKQIENFRIALSMNPMIGLAAFIVPDSLIVDIRNRMAADIAHIAVEPKKPTPRKTYPFT